MMRYRIVLLSLFMILSGVGARGEVRVRVTDQASFDRLSETLRQALEGDDQEVVVDIRKDVYRYREGHLTLKGLFLPRKRITLQCNGATFIPDGPDYILKPALSRMSSVPCKGPFDYRNGFVDLASLKSVDMRGAVRGALSRPEILDRAHGKCRVKVDEPDLPSSSCQGVYLILSQWYRGIVYPVEKIESGYLYFKSEKVTDDRNAETDPDADYKFHRELPHYILYNHPDGDQDLFMSATHLYGRGPRRIRQCEASNFLTFSNSVTGAFCLENAVFIGNSAGEPLIHFDGLRSTETAVRNCSFEGIRSDVIRVHGSTNILICDNVMKGIYRRCITLDFFTCGAEVRGNRFSDTGLMMDNHFCIDSQASGIRIHHNTFENFTYGAIGVGTFYMESIPASSSGVIEENEFYCTSAFLKKPARLLMDSGAIYTWTINKDMTIRNNYIHDIDGYGENRGIFCDDGTVNVKIVGNRIRRVRNSYCIDLRLCLPVERHPLSRIARVNVGNKMENNDVDGTVRFENRD